MEVYLDNAATTAVSEKVRDVMSGIMSEDYGNPSSLHMKGIVAEKYINEARKNIAGLLKVQDKEIIFTSGGTEANNTAIIGCARANCRAGRHIITTSVEHPSVYEVMKYLEKEGFEVTYLPVDGSGRIAPDAVKNALREDTSLVSVMYVNNEIGSVMPIAEIGRLVHEYKSSIVFHTDAIQAFGKYRIFPKKTDIDVLSVSAHKFHGPKGTGFLYLRNGVKMQPLIYGGGQQRGVRSGTENVAGIAGMGLAACEAYRDFDEKISKMIKLRDDFTDRLLTLDNVTVHSKKGSQGAPHIINASFIGVRSEVFLHSLEEMNVYVSSGSACSSNKNSVSRTLKAIGLTGEETDSALRFSICDATDAREMDYAFQTIAGLLPKRRVLRQR